MSIYAPDKSEFDEESLASHRRAESEDEWLAEQFDINKFMEGAEKVKEDLKELMKEPVF